MSDEDVSVLIDHFKNQWKNLQENKSYKVHCFMVVLTDKKKNYYKVLLLVNNGETFGNDLLKGQYKNNIIKLNENKSLLSEAGFKSTPLEYNYKILHKPNFEEFASFTTSGTNKYFGHTFTRVGKLLFKYKNIEKFLKSDK